MKNVNPKTSTIAAAISLSLAIGLSGCANQASSPVTAAAPNAAPLTATSAQTIDTILAGAHRSDANKARDKFRNPKETLSFFRVTPASTVVEIQPGGGWYTEILAPLLRDKGNYVAAIPHQSTRGLKAFQDKLATAPALYDKAKIMPLGQPADAPQPLSIRPEGGADAVLTFRNVHNWMNENDDKTVDIMMKSFFDALKPGGVLGIVEHRAPAGTTRKQSVTSGYVSEAYVIERAQAAGFKLDAKSEINANPKDTKDYPKGVWTLPPTLVEKDVNRDKYLAIGESDRMTLRFVKPAK